MSRQGVESRTGRVRWRSGQSIRDRRNRAGRRGREAQRHRYAESMFMQDPQPRRGGPLHNRCRPARGCGWEGLRLCHSPITAANASVRRPKPVRPHLARNRIHARIRGQLRTWWASKMMRSLRRLSGRTATKSTLTRLCVSWFITDHPGRVLQRRGPSSGLARVSFFGCHRGLGQRACRMGNCANRRTSRMRSPTPRMRWRSSGCAQSTWPMRRARCACRCSSRRSRISV